MPYVNKWVNNSRLCSHKGVAVYHTYKDDELEQGETTNYFTTEKDGCFDMAFDVRDLPTWKEPPHPPYHTGENATPEIRKAWDKYFKDKVYDKAVIAAIKKAIDKGIITEEGVQYVEPA